MNTKKNTSDNDRWAKFERELDRDVEKFVAARNELKEYQDTMQARHNKFNTLSKSKPSFNFFGLDPFFRTCHA